MTTIDLYKMDLKVYGYKNIPRFYRSKSFHERIDGLLMLICRQCPYLTILVSFFVFDFIVYVYQKSSSL